MFNPRAYSNSRPGGIAVFEVVTAPDQPAIGEQRTRFVPLKRTVANGHWSGPLAEFTLTQTYGYTRAQCDRTLEAVYRFPLPGDAAVRQVIVSFGDAEIRAELRARADAETEYAEARSHGHQAALVTAESPDVFTLRVAGLQPDEDVTVETTYVQLAEPDGDGWSLRIPLTTAPRYSRDDEPDAERAQPLAVFRDPGHRFALDLLSSFAGRVTSPTHALDSSDEDGRRRVRLRERDVRPDRDCVLVWRPERETTRSALRLLLGPDPAGNQTYFLALVVPPSAPASVVTREALVLVDHSGSMSGPKWEAADWAALKALGDLAPTDRANLGVFNNLTTWQSRAPRPAGTDAVARGQKFLKQHCDSGGTELGTALEQSFLMPRESGEASRQVILITDAEVSDFARILALVDAEARRADRRRVSVLCIDAAPNSFLAREIARKGGGIARFLTSSSEAGDITTALSTIIDGWSQPVRAGLCLEVNRAGAEALEREVSPATTPDWSTVDLGDLTAGRPVWVAGRVPGSSADLAFRLVGPAGDSIADAETETSVVSAGAIASLLGAWKVLGLETLRGARGDAAELREGLIGLGYDPDAVLGASGRRTRYGANESLQTTQALDDLLLKEALAFGLLCSATGFVAVRREAGKVVEETVGIANALPGGWSEGFVSHSLAMPSMAPSPAVPPPSASKKMHRSSGSLLRRISRTATTGAPPPANFDMAGISAEEAIEPEAARDEPLVSDLSASSDRASDASAEDVPSIMRWIRDARGPGAPGPASRAHPGRTVLHEGPLPPFAGERATLFDTGRPADAARLSGARTFSRLVVEVDDADPGQVDPDLVLLVFVGDLAAPVARVRLVDLLRQGGVRPLNIRRRATDRVIVVLEGPAGAWREGVHALMLSVE